AHISLRWPVTDTEETDTAGLGAWQAAYDCAMESLSFEPNTARRIVPPFFAAPCSAVSERVTSLEPARWKVAAPESTVRPFTDQTQRTRSAPVVLTRACALTLQLSWLVAVTRLEASTFTFGEGAGVWSLQWTL